MIEGPSRDLFFEHKNDIWGAYHWVMDRPQVQAVGVHQIAYLADDLAIREVLINYATALDAKDLERVTSGFIDDAVLVTPRLTLLGRHEIEGFYRATIATPDLSFHRVMNVVVRVQPGAHEGWIAAYFHAPTLYDTRTRARSLLGQFFGRVVKLDARWYIADWRISCSFEPHYAASGDASGKKVRMGRIATDAAREQFMAMAGDMLTAHRTLLERFLPQRDDERLDWLFEELKVRELLATYCFAQDAKDPVWMTSLLAADATLSSDTEFCAGREQLNRQFEEWRKIPFYTFQRYANPIIRFDPGHLQCWVGAYWHVSGVDDDGKRRSRFGRSFGRLLKQGGVWRIADWRNSVDLRFDFADGELQTLYNGRLPEMPTGAHHDLVFQGSRKQFYEIAKDLWGGVRWIVSEPVRADTRHEKAELLRENIQVRDHFTRYAESYDSSNVARVMHIVLAKDSIHAPRQENAGILVGKEEIRKQYQVWNAARRLSFHRVTNIIVRILSGGQEAWGCGYFSAPMVAHTNEAQSQFGGYVFRFLKEHGDWRLADRRSIGPGAGKGIRVASFPYATPTPNDAEWNWS